MRERVFVWDREAKSEGGRGGEQERECMYVHSCMTE